MVLNNGDSGYDSIFQHYLFENKPRRFNYQGYFWQTEGQDPVLTFRQMTPLPNFDRTSHTDRPPLKQVTPLDDTPKDPFA